MSEKPTSQPEKERLSPPSDWTIALVVVSVFMMAILSIIYFSPILFNSSKSDQKEVISPILAAVLFIINLTFLSRLLWIINIKVIQRPYTITNNKDPFKPERTIFFAASIIIIAAILPEIDCIEPHLKDPFQGAEVDNWLMSLLVLVPLAEVYGGSWGKLRAVKETGRGAEEIIWPKYWKKKPGKPHPKPAPLLELSSSPSINIISIVLTATVTTTVTVVIVAVITAEIIT